MLQIKEKKKLRERSEIGEGREGSSAAGFGASLDFQPPSKPRI